MQKMAVLSLIGIGAAVGTANADEGIFRLGGNYANQANSYQFVGSAPSQYYLVDRSGSGGYQNYRPNPTYYTQLPCPFHGACNYCGSPNCPGNHGIWTIPAVRWAVDPNYYALQNELNSVRGEIVNFKQQQEQAENQALLGEINSFATKAEHFEEARPTMIQLLQSGVASTLEEAYEKAIRLNDDLYQQIQQRSQAEAETAKRESANRAAKAAKAAAVSVKSSTPGNRTTTTKAQDRRSMLLEQFDSINERF